MTIRDNYKYGVKIHFVSKGMLSLCSNPLMNTYLSRFGLGTVVEEIINVYNYLNFCIREIEYY